MDTGTHNIIDLDAHREPKVDDSPTGRWKAILNNIEHEPLNRASYYLLGELKMALKEIGRGTK